MDNRGMNRDTPRPQNSARNMDHGNTRHGNMDRGNMNRGNMNRGGERQAMNRPMPQENRGGNPRSAPRVDNRMENRGGPAPRPNARAENAHPHENAPRQDREDRGRK
jgi:hypothetical protein